MRILHVIGSFITGGAQTQLLGLVKAAHGRYWEASVVALAGGDLEPEFRRLGVPVTVLHRRASPGLGRLVALRRIVARGRFDLVNSHLWHANAYARLATLGIGDAPVVVIVEHNLETSRQRWRRDVDRVLASRTAASVAVTEAMGEFLARMHPMPTGGFTAIPYAIDKSVFHPGVSSAQRAAHRIGGLGRLVPEKGWEVLIDAVAELVATGLPVDAEIGGEGPLRSALEARASGLPVRFIGVLPSGPPVAEWMRSLDVLVLPSLHREARPVVVLEGLSTGVPVIATDIPGMAETIAGGGLLVAPGDVPAMAAAIRSTLDDPARRDRTLGAAELILDFDQLAACYERLFRRTIETVRT